MAALLDQLRREHANIRGVLTVLERQVRAFAADAHPDYALMQAAVEYLGSFPEASHHPKEDLVFARLKARDPKALAAIGDLHGAHEKLKANLLEFAEALRAVVADAEIPRSALVHRAEAFLELQRRHMAMEEASFFPAVERTFNAADWEVVAMLLRPATDPLHGAAGDARFDALRRDIMAWEEN